MDGQVCGWGNVYCSKSYVCVCDCLCHLHLRRGHDVVLGARHEQERTRHALAQLHIRTTWRSINMHTHTHANAATAPPPPLHLPSHIHTHPHLPTRALTSNHPLTPSPRHLVLRSPFAFEYPGHDPLEAFEEGEQVHRHVLHGGERVLHDHATNAHGWTATCMHVCARGCVRLCACVCLCVCTGVHFWRTTACMRV